MLHVPPFDITVEADSSDEIMRLLTNELFERPMVPMHIRYRIENSVRLFVVNMKHGESAKIEVKSTLDALGLGTCRIEYTHYATPERAPQP